MRVCTGEVSPSNGSLFARDVGRAEDARLGDPMLVCLGVVARGGGIRGVLRRCNVSSTSGAEPVGRLLAQPNVGRILLHLRFMRALYSLSCKSMALLVMILLPRAGDSLRGEEKTPAMGSIPCSSRTPVSLSVTPVFLRSRQLHNANLASFGAISHLPTLPTSKY